MELTDVTALPVPQHTPPSIQHGLDRVLFKYELPVNTRRNMLTRQPARVCFIYETRDPEYTTLHPILRRFFP